jgi:nuclear receptor co-repressor 1
LEKCAPRRKNGLSIEGAELPMYNQPSDTHLYYVNKRNHTFFKRILVERFKKRNEDKEARERYMTETYTKIMSTWSKKVEKIENSKRRKEREAKARELYEKIFPELRKQREDKERDHRLGSRGAVRSEADIEDVIERLQEQEVIFDFYSFLDAFAILRFSHC